MRPDRIAASCCRGLPPPPAASLGGWGSAGRGNCGGWRAAAPDQCGVRKRVETRGGRLRAAHVVRAGNVHIGKLMPRLAATLLPIWTYLATTAPLGPRLLDAITYDGAVSDSERADNHYRIVGGDRLLASGRATLWEAGPRRFAPTSAADIATLYP